MANCSAIEKLTPKALIVEDQEQLMRAPVISWAIRSLLCEFSVLTVPSVVKNACLKL